MPANNPGREDPYPHQTHVRTFNDQADAWELARAIAAALKFNGLTPTFGVRSLPLAAGNKAKRHVVQIGGPGPLPSPFREEIERRFGEATAMTVIAAVFDPPEPPAPVARDVATRHGWQPQGMFRDEATA